MADNGELTRELAKVISDPGSVLPRYYYRPGERETEAQWAARAVLFSLPRLAAGPAVDTGRLPHDSFCEAESQPTCQCAERRLGATVDTAPEGEVLEADDTVPVERLAHWLHGEFDAGMANSELLTWAQEREEIKDRYRNTAHALMSQLPELFREVKD